MIENFPDSIALDAMQSLLDYGKDKVQREIASPREQGLRRFHIVFDVQAEDFQQALEFFIASLFGNENIARYVYGFESEEDLVLPSDSSAIPYRRTLLTEVEPTYYVDSKEGFLNEEEVNTFADEFYEQISGDSPS